MSVSSVCVWSLDDDMEEQAVSVSSVCVCL